MSMGQSAAIKIDGIEETILGLKRFEPDGYKRLRRNLRRAGQVVSNLANARAPLAAQGGFGVRFKDYGKNPGMVIHARSGSKLGKNAAIFEFAGKPGNVRVPQGRAMIDWLSGSYGSPGRFMWQAWDLKRASVLAEVDAIWHQGEAELQAAMDKAGVL